jgi:voltage-gated potassium channel Kch
MRWTVLAGLTVVAVVLGHWGFERLPDGDEWSFWDSLHRSVQLFVLESGGVAPPVPWQLEVARFLAPAITIAAAALALLALFREQARLLAVRRLYRDHIVVAGMGEKGFALAQRLVELGGQVVGVERDPSAPALAGCRARGIPVVIGDASDPAVLGRAALRRAPLLLVVCGDDGVNANVVAAARRVEGARLAAFAHLADFDLWRHLSGHELAAVDGTGVLVEFFNVADAAARMLLESHPPFDPGTESPHVVVAGVDGIGESVVLNAARAWLAERPDPVSRMRLTIAGPDAAADLARLLESHPRLGGICDMRAWPPEESPAVTAVYVCSSPEGRAVSTALGLRASGLVDPAPIVVAVHDERAGVASALHDDGGVIPFGVVQRAVTPEVVTWGTTETIARAKHAQYVRDERARGQTPETNPSMAPWHELDESLQLSNRRFALGVGAKLREAGLVVVPAPLADPAAVESVLSATQVEELAIAEHDRWCADLIADGWRHGPGPKDPERKLHPSLVPWSELPEEERDKDREPVRALPEMLAHVGFELRPAGEGPPAARYAQPALP